MFLFNTLLICILCSTSLIKFSTSTKPVINILTQLSTKLLQVEFRYEGPKADLIILNCRHFKDPWNRNHEITIREVGKVPSTPGKSFYSVLVKDPYLGNSCIRVCAKFNTKRECSIVSYLSVLSYSDDIKSVLNVKQSELGRFWPYMLSIEKHGLDFNTHFKFKYFLRYDGKGYHSVINMFTCRFTFEPFTLTSCRRLDAGGFGIFDTVHTITKLPWAVDTGRFVIFVCLRDPHGSCSPPFYYETKNTFTEKPIFPYISRVEKFNKFGYSNFLNVEWYYDTTKSIHWMQVAVGSCYNGLNIIASKTDTFNGPGNKLQKYYRRVFKNLPRGLNCVQACDGNVGSQRCSRPLILYNADEKYIDKQGRPKITRAVKKSRFGYSNEVEIFYGIPPSLFQLSPIVDIYRCQFTENPFRVYNYTWANWKSLGRFGPEHNIIISNMPIGGACVTICGMRNKIESCSLPYKIDNYIKTRTMMDSPDSPRVVSMKKFTKFAYSNNINLTWYYPKSLIDKHPFMHIYTCQYSEPSSTFNYTLAVRLKADKNRDNYKLEIYNLPTGRVCLVICGDSKTSEMCGSIFKFENLVDVNLKNVPSGLIRISGFKRKVKYGYTSGIELSVKFPSKTQKTYPYMVIYRCEYTYYPKYQTSNYTIAMRVKGRNNVEDYSLTVEGMPIGLACIHVCAENNNFETCGLPYRVKNTRKVEEKDYTRNAPKIIHVAKALEHGYSSMASVRFSYPSEVTAKFDAISIYRCRYYENPLRTFDYSLAMELRASGDKKIHTTQINDLPRGKACVQICAMNEDFESCGLPYKIVN